MGNTLERSYAPTLIEILSGNQFLLSKILTATVSASILVISLRKLQNFGIFSAKDTKPIQWKKVGRVDKLFLHPLKGAKESEQNVSYFGSMGMQSEAGLHDRSFMLVDETRYIINIFGSFAFY